jgi:hypothetical protein
VKAFKTVYRALNNLVMAASGAVAVVVGMRMILTGPFRTWGIDDGPMGLVPDRSVLVALAVIGAGLVALQVAADHGRALLRWLREDGS